jgi:hypothetical protein
VSPVQAVAPRALTRQAAAERWAVSVDVIDQLVRQGHVEAKKYGKSKARTRHRTLVLVASLDDYFESLEDA